MAMLNKNIFSLDITESAQALAKRFRAVCDSRKGSSSEVSYPRDFSRLLSFSGGKGSKQKDNKE
jgi:hypothetical protein